jgi:dolichol kinase
MFARALVVAPGLLAAGTAAAAAALAAVEAARVAAVPLLGPAVHAFMVRFVDGRDGGRVLVSHFSLLAGMAGPVWLVVAPTLPDAPLPPALAAPALAGIVALGALDTAASAVGRAVGRRRLFGTPKTLEGAAAGAAAAVAAWAATAAAVGGAPSAATALVAGVLMAGLEASTTQLDNVFLPLHGVAVVAAGW